MARTSTPKRTDGTKKPRKPSLAVPDKGTLVEALREDGRHMTVAEQLAAQALQLDGEGTKVEVIAARRVSEAERAGVAGPLPATGPMREPPFSKLTCTIKGNHEVALGGLTAIVGPNRAGKTSLLLGYELAVRGLLNGRPNPSDLFELSPPGCEVFGATVEGRAGSCRLVVATEPGAGGPQPKRPEHTVDGMVEKLTAEELANAIPTIHLGDLLGTGGSKARSTMLRRWGNLTELTAPAHLGEELGALWDEAAATLAKAHPGNIAEQLAGLPQEFKTAKLAAGRERGKAERAYEELRAKLAVKREPAKAEIEEAKSALERMRLAERTVNLFAARAKFEADKAALIALVEVLPEELPAAPKAPVESRTPSVVISNPNLEKDKVLRNTLKLMLEKCGAAGTCVCGGKFGPEEHAAFEATIAGVEARIAGSAAGTRAETAAAQDGYAAAWATYQAEKQAWDSLSAKFAHWHQEELRLKSVKNALEEGFKAVGIPFDAPAPTENAGNILEQEAHVNVLIALQSEFERLHKAREQVSAFETAGTLAKRLETEAEKLATEKLATAKHAAEDAVSKHLPWGMTAFFEVDTGRWGLVYGAEEPDEAYFIPAAGCSGSEFGSLYIALAVAWSVDMPLRALLIDDDILGRFDPEGVTAFLNKIEAAYHAQEISQALVAWTRPDEVPESWTQLAVGG